MLERDRGRDGEILKKAKSAQLVDGLRSRPRGRAARDRLVASLMILEGLWSGCAVADRGCLAYSVWCSVHVMSLFNIIPNDQCPRFERPEGQIALLYFSDPAQ